MTTRTSSFRRAWRLFEKAEWAYPRQRAGGQYLGCQRGLIDLPEVDPTMALADEFAGGARENTLQDKSGRRYRVSTMRCSDAARRPIHDVGDAAGCAARPYAAGLHPASRARSLETLSNS